MILIRSGTSSEVAGEGHGLPEAPEVFAAREFPGPRG